MRTGFGDKKRGVFSVQMVPNDRKIFRILEFITKNHDLSFPVSSKSGVIYFYQKTSFLFQCLHSFVFKNLTDMLLNEKKVK